MSEKKEWIEDKLSVILPVYNAEQWLDECLESVCRQTFQGEIELSIYTDACRDKSESIIETWRRRLAEKDVQVTVGGHSDDKPRGVGYAKNQAVQQSTGTYLCFLDSDDVMAEDRLEQQYQACRVHPHCIIGSKFHRLPEDSTERFTRWANTISQDQLCTQAYTSHGPSVIMPTWFCRREIFDRVGGFDEGGKCLKVGYHPAALIWTPLLEKIDKFQKSVWGTPEDLIFFYRHLELGGGLYRVDRDLLTYRYHPGAATFSVTVDSIWKLRVEFLQKQIISKWSKFTIWNAGKQGRKLFRSLTLENQEKVVAFCDVDIKKISKGYYIYEESMRKPKPAISVVHFKEAKAPFIICVKMDLTKGEFEKNLESLQLREGEDYIHFN